ncbi:hypothetical protein T4B_2315 [Trichinella pseudospiralis]|uniref:Uncharacterized protein n=1 Tax=Trichinella pseudospiralis TaxID=6337 RepID=A0A0V1J3L1_TRIPS|nr:hypothetical protein T4A_9619 [Trichinella pseudospiralis]KRZ29506.1 hypothetical protein T4B_2315 [Trichinella pseudospiralis]
MKIQEAEKYGMIPTVHVQLRSGDGDDDDDDDDDGGGGGGDGSGGGDAVHSPQPD